jgi:hypothetical protein
MKSMIPNKLYYHDMERESNSNEVLCKLNRTDSWFYKNRKLPGSTKTIFKP